MEKLVKFHCNDEDHVLAVENNIIDADPEYKIQGRVSER